VESNGKPKAGFPPSTTLAELAGASSHIPQRDRPRRVLENQNQVFHTPRLAPNLSEKNVDTSIEEERGTFSIELTLDKFYS